MKKRVWKGGGRPPLPCPMCKNPTECQTCGVVFTPSRGLLCDWRKGRHSGNFYCSRKCYGIARRGIVSNPWGSRGRPVPKTGVVHPAGLVCAVVLILITITALRVIGWV